MHEGIEWSIACRSDQVLEALSDAEAQLYEMASPVRKWPSGMDGYGMDFFWNGKKIMAADF